MIEVTNETYSKVADSLRDKIGNAEWFNGTVDLETELCAARLTLSAIVYRRNESLPEGNRRPIVDIVPVWWDFSTTTADGPATNDFSFARLKPHLVEHD
jgi:hypothetical protein